MSNESFKKLNLNQKYIQDWIVQYADSHFEKASVSELTQVSSNQHRCEIIVDSKKIIIDFYFNKDGTTSINYNVGKNKDLSLKIAEFLKTKTSTNDTNGRSFSIPIFNKKDFDLLKEYLLKELGEVKLLESLYNETNRAEIYKFQSKYGDQLTIQYYKNGRLLVQGKPLYLFQEVVYFIARFLPFEDVIKQQEEFFGTHINPDKVKEEIKYRLPNSKSLFDENHIKILSSSISLKNSNVTLEEYSCFAHPALRVLEAYLKKLFKYVGINIKKNNFDMFKPDDKGYYILEDDTKKQIPDLNMQAAIEKCYNLYRRERHSLSHASDQGFRTRVIEKKEDAIQIIDEVINTIESTYSTIKHKISH